VHLGYNKEVRFASKVALLLVLAFVLAATAGARPTASGTLAWKGWDDKIGGWWNPHPDDIRDGHFALSVNAPGATVSAIVLNGVRPDGSIASNHEWNTVPRDGKWMLGVFRGGAQVNATDVNICDPVGSRTAHYDLYAEDDKLIEKFADWRVLVRFSNGTETTAKAKLGDTSDGPPAPPVSGVAIPSGPQPTGTEPCAASKGESEPGAGVLRISLAKASALAKKTVKARACATVYSSYSQEVPASSAVAIERRAAGAKTWSVVKRGGASLSAQACAKTRGAASFRSTLRQGTKVLVTSNLVTVTWK
jgi:hypothetical protein